MKVLLVTAALAATLSSYSQFAAAGEGSDHGNGTDHSELVYPGARKGAPVDPEALPEPKKLLNKLILTGPATFQFSAEAKKIAIIPFSPDDLLRNFEFPASSSTLSALARSAQKGGGDFSDLTNPRNPFSKFAFQRYTHQPTDPTDFINQELVSFPNNKIADGLRGMSMTFEVAMNPDLTGGKCGACAPSDFESLPAQGITYKVMCMFAGSPLYEIPNSQFTITSQTQVVQKTIDVMPDRYLMTLVDWAKRDICKDPTATRRNEGLNCFVVPASVADSTSSSEKIKSEIVGEQTASSYQIYNALGSRSVGLVNMAAVQDAKTYTASSTLVPQTTYHSGNIEVSGGAYYIPTPFHHTSIDDYRLRTDDQSVTTYVSVLSAKSDLAEMVRRSYITAYAKGVLK